MCTEVGVSRKGLYKTTERLREGGRGRRGREMTRYGKRGRVDKKGRLFRRLSKKNTLTLAPE